MIFSFEFRFLCILVALGITLWMIIQHCAEGCCDPKDRILQRAQHAVQSDVMMFRVGFITLMGLL